MDGILTNLMKRFFFLLYILLTYFFHDDNIDEYANFHLYTRGNACTICTVCTYTSYICVIDERRKWVCDDNNRRRCRFYGSMGSYTYMCVIICEFICAEARWDKKRNVFIMLLNNKFAYIFSTQNSIPISFFFLVRKKLWFISGG